MFLLVRSLYIVPLIFISVLSIFSSIMHQMVCVFLVYVLLQMFNIALHAICYLILSHQVSHLSLIYVIYAYVSLIQGTRCLLIVSFGWNTSRLFFSLVQHVLSLFYYNLGQCNDVALSSLIHTVVLIRSVLSSSPAFSRCPPNAYNYMVFYVVDMVDAIEIPLSCPINVGLLSPCAD